MKRSKKRFLYMLFVGLGVSVLLKLLIVFPKNDWYVQTMGVLESILITFLIWEGNLWIDEQVNERFPWQKNPKRRILVQFPISAIYSSVILLGIILFFSKYVCSLPGQEQEKFLTISITTGMLVSIFLLTLETSAHFFRQWKLSLTAIEQYKAESAQAHLENLKNQINPHFLFNNMSVLSSLVYQDQDKAAEFIHQLSKVYRYLLDTRTNELISLEEELTFISSYTFLLNIRYSPNLSFLIEIDERYKCRKIPPMALQLLIENVIKHNEISSSKPLTVCISIHDEQLVICNPIQARLHPEPSSETGLKNIAARYVYFTERKVEITRSDDEFCVKIPLIDMP